MQAATGASTTDWGTSINTFLSTALGGDVKKLLTGLAVVGIIIGIIHSAFKNHTRLGKMFRRDIEVIIVGIFVATPTLWAPIVSFVAGLVGDIPSWLTRL
jgi:hypothetical protein